MKEHRYADDQTIAEARRLYGMGMSAIQIAERVGFSSRAVHRWVKRKCKPVASPSRMPDLSDGLCNSDPELPELFFAGGDTRAAKMVCVGCPVQRQCLDYGIERADELEGIWGGWGQRTRLRLQKLAR